MTNDFSPFEGLYVEVAGAKGREGYARRERTITQLERIPVNYYDKEVLFTRKPKRNVYTTGFVNGKKVLLKRFRKEPSYTREVQTNYLSNVLSKLSPVEKIVSTSPVSEKIILKGGEIGFGIEGRNRYIQLSLYRKDQDPEVLYQSSRKLVRGITPVEAFRNAKAGISNLLLAREFKKRDEETYARMARYETEQAGLRKRQFENTYGIAPENIDSGILKALKLQEDLRRKFRIVAPAKKNNSVVRAPSKNGEINQESLKQVSDTLNSEFYDIGVAS